MTTNADIVEWDALAEWRNDVEESETLVVTNGCFDLLHAGHVDFLQKCSRLGQVLLVGVNSDRAVSQLKGPQRPLFGERDRVEMLAAISCVDAVCLFDFVCAAEFLERARPNIWAKGGDYSFNNGLNPLEIEKVEAAGGQVVLLRLVREISTTAILKRLVVTERAHAVPTPRGGGQ